MARVEVKNLVRKPSIHDISFEVSDKEFMCMLGPSGCGKTTTLRCIAGLSKPDSGEIFIGDTLMNKLEPWERPVRMMFQSYALYPTMTTYDIIAFPLKMLKKTQNEIRERTMEVAELLRLTHVLDHKPGELSGGERQRVALGRTIAIPAEVYLLDEPFTNLDAKLRAHMRGRFKDIQKELGSTIILSTPDQAEAMALGDRITVMDKGRVLQYGKPDIIYDRPINLFVAGFVGAPPMNLIDCSLVERDGETFLDAAEFTLAVPELKEVIKEKATGSELILGIRPEDISITEEEIDESIKAKVMVVERTKPDAVIHLRVGEKLLEMTEEEHLFKYEAGDEVFLVFDRNKIHIFDKKSSEMII